MTRRPWADGYVSVGQRIRPKLEMHHYGGAALAALFEPGRPVAAGRPQSAALPAGIGIIDAPVEPLGVEAHRIRHAQRDHLAVLECDQAVVEIASRHWNIVAKPEGVVLIDPAVVARLGAIVADALKAGARVFVE